jgi:ketosteroid isomerase-like protein
MNRITRFFALLLLTGAAAPPVQGQVTAELDRYWAEVSRTVAEGDFEGYAATYHPDAVLVSLGSRNSYPISQALAGWKNGFDQTQAGRMKAGVEFRFSRRLNDAATAHDTGMFRYFSQETGAQPQVVLLHFEALLVKKDGAWKMMMEFQKAPATEAEWEDAASGRDW